jgi:tRNA-2-methylthio-N6-dimethylallyladenosine synthase
VAEIRAAIPGASLTTDIIVGFPGESEAMFDETLALMGEVRFDALTPSCMLAAFRNAAAAMPDQIPLPVKKERLKRLMDLQNDISLEINRGLS